MTFGQDSAPVQAGDVLAGKYRVDKVLGIGGMGVVVAATHLHLDQKVAIKFMLPWALANQSAVERFAREAKAAVRLKSEHVARILDVGTLETGSPYMVMEFLDGMDLCDLIEQPGQRIEPAVAVDYLLQACDAVAEAHALGIIHRDLKPRNLFLTHGNDGNPVVKVLDFGISKVLKENDLSLTRTTEIIGSPNYMSPEQLKASRNVDARSDVWALGVILYELLGKRVPFVAESITQLTAMVFTEAPRPLEELRPDIPPGLIKVISHCLEKDATRRFQSVADLATALAPFAPPQSRALVDRVRRISEASRPSSIPLVPGSSPAVGALPGTNISWSETELDDAGSKKRRTVAVIVGVGTLVMILAIGTLYLAFRRPTVSPAATLGASLASASPSASVLDPPVDASTAAPAASVAAASATATTRPLPPGRPHGNGRPPRRDAAAAGDGIPDERL